MNVANDALAAEESNGAGAGSQRDESPGDRAHWPDIARRWAQVGTPLRPIAQDLELFMHAIRCCDVPPRALILEVTPELYRLPWPEGTSLLAVDHTPAMIDAVWPGPRTAVICAEWTDLPLPAASRDIVLCDGGLHLLSNPHGHAQLVRSLHRVIAPRGLCVLRLFVPPPRREAPEIVLQDLLAGRVSNLNVLKLRLGMSLQEDRTHGVRLSNVWDAVHRAAPDFPRLAAQLGWTLEHLSAIDTYRDCPRHYHFVTVAEVRELFCVDPGGFEFDTIDTPSYELGEQCPMIVFRRT